MIVRSGHPFTLRDLFDRFGLISIQRRVGRYCRPRLNPRRHTFAALGVWSLVSDLADVNRTVPNISDIAREQRPSLAPVGFSIIVHRYQWPSRRLEIRFGD